MLTRQENPSASAIAQVLQEPNRTLIATIHRKLGAGACRRPGGLYRDYPMTHWLHRAHRSMVDAGYGQCWLPGSTTWRHFCPDWPTAQAERQAIARAQRDGYLTRDTGIPQLTRDGWQRY